VGEAAVKGFIVSVFIV